MKLPSAERAFVDPNKVREYLLNPHHLVGSSKARIFATLGFTRRRWAALYEALHTHAIGGEAKAGHPSPYGQKYTVRAMITGPNGREAHLVSVWIVLKDEDFPRLVTAYPGEPDDESDS